MNNSVEQRARAYENNPEALQQRYAQNQQLIDLLALQKLKSEKEAAARDIQLKMGQRGKQPTIAEQREKEVGDMTRQEVAQQTAGAMQQKQQEQQQALQQVTNAAQGAPAGLPSIPQPGMMTPKAMAAGGIVAFEKGGNEGLKKKNVRNDPAMRIDPKVQKVRDTDKLQILLEELKREQARPVKDAEDEQRKQGSLEAIRREIRRADPKLGRAVDTSGIPSVIPSVQAAETQPANKQPAEDKKRFYNPASFALLHPFGGSGGPETSSSMGRIVRDAFDRIGLQSAPSPQALEANRLVQERQRLLDEQAKVAGSFGFKQQNAEDIAKYERIQADLRRNMQASQAGPARPTTVPVAEKYTGEGMAGEGLASIPTSPPAVAAPPAPPAAITPPAAPAAPAAPAPPAALAVPSAVAVAPVPNMDSVPLGSEVAAASRKMLSIDPEAERTRALRESGIAYGRTPEEKAIIAKNRAALEATDAARFDPERISNERLTRFLLGGAGRSSAAQAIAGGGGSSVDYREAMDAEKRQRMLERQTLAEADIKGDRDIRGKVYDTGRSAYAEGLGGLGKAVTAAAPLVESAQRLAAQLKNSSLDRQTEVAVANINATAHKFVADATRDATSESRRNTNLAQLQRYEDLSLAQIADDVAAKIKALNNQRLITTDPKEKAKLDLQEIAIESDRKAQRANIINNYTTLKERVSGGGGGGSTEGWSKHTVVPK